MAVELKDGRARTPVPVRTIAATIAMVLATAFCFWCSARSRGCWCGSSSPRSSRWLYPVVNWVERRVTRGRRSLATLLVFGRLLSSAACSRFRGAAARQEDDRSPASSRRYVEDAQAGRGPVGQLLTRTNA